MKGMIVFLPFLFFLANMTGCGSTVKNNDIKIGITVYDQYDVYIDLLLRDINDYMNNSINKWGVNVNLEIHDSGINQSEQNEQVDNCIQNGCDVVLVNLVDRTDTGAIIDMAKKYDVPIIFFNREPVKEDLKRWSKLFYVGASAKESGKIQGKIVAEYVKENFLSVDKNGDGILQYTILEGEPDHQDAIVRTEYSIKTIEEYGIRLEKTGGAITNWNRDQARAKITSLIEENNYSELIISNNDNMALGAVDAFEEAEIPLESRPLIVGIDGIPEALEAIRSGAMLGTVYNDKEGQAKAISELAVSLIKEDYEIDYSEYEDYILEDDKNIKTHYREVTAKDLSQYQ